MSEVVKFMRPCCEEFRPITGTEWDQPYFDVMASRTFIRGGGALYEVTGKHFEPCHYSDVVYVCLMNIVTGERNDISQDMLDSLLVRAPSWRLLAEMEVIAWSIK